MANKSIQAITVFSVIALFPLLSCVCADEGVIHGYVNDPEGNPLEGIMIEIYEKENRTNPVTQTKSDINGSYSVKLKNGTYRLRVIGGSDSWIYQKTKIDYFRDITWHQQPLEITNNSALTVSITLGITPWDWIAAAVFFVLCLIIFDQVVLLRRYNFDLIGNLFFKIKYKISHMIKPSIIVSDSEKIRLKTHQVRCPITKIRLVEIPRNKLYNCPVCNTYYHYDSIKQVKECINCNEPVVAIST